MKVQGAHGTRQSREVVGTAMSWKRAVSGSDMTASVLSTVFSKTLLSSVSHADDGFIIRVAGRTQPMSYGRLLPL